jgi:hypothetical protein
MAFGNGPKIVTDGLVLNLDAADRNSYVSGSTTWFDVSGNNYSGSLVNNPTFNSLNGGNFVFTASNSHITLGTPPALNTIQVPLTIIGWANLGTNSRFCTLYGVYKDTLGGQIYSMVRLDNGILKYYSSAVTSPYFQESGTFRPTLGNWAFYAVTVSGSVSTPTVTIYLNSNSQTFLYTPFTSSLSLSPTVDFRVGGNQAQVNGETWSGSIASIQVYNKVLSPAEITQNYNAQKSRFGL